MSTFQDLYCTEYKKLPSCNPDFIYLDGRGQDKVKKNINNFTIANNIDMCPMASDILKFEFFCYQAQLLWLMAEAKTLFFKKKSQEKLKYKYIEHFDQHFLFLDEKYLGPINKKQLKFYKS